MAGMRGTLVLYAALTGGAGTERTGVSIGTTFSSSPLYRLMGSATNKWQFQIRNSDSSGATNLYSATTPTTGKLYGVVATCAGVSGTMRMFVDGVLEASATAPAGTMSSLNRAGVGVLSRGAVEQLFVGDIVLAGLYQDEFSPEQAIEVSANPWMAFRSVRRRFTVVASGATIAATVGNATAAGSTAAIESSVTIGAGIGDAVAAGTTASITTGASVDCTVGDAVATGAQATISSAITIAANVGNSVAAGSTADVSTATVVACTTGNATAAGLAASISGTVSIVCSVGDAVAAGSAASITAAGALNAAEIADAVWDEPMVDAITARTIMSGMADFLRSRGHLP